MPMEPPRFTDPPSSPAPPRSKKAVGAVPVSESPLSDNQGDVVASLVPDDDLSDLLPTEGLIISPVQASDSALSTGKVILIHVLTDGFTAAGQVWYRGQEIEYVVGEQAFEDTKDRKGDSWLMCDDASQMRRWGQVMFGRGPWPGSDYEDPRAAAAERSRGRKPKALAGIAPPRQR